MQKKRINSNAILDRLHRGVVWTCIGLTLYGTYLLGARGYRYVTVVRPARQKEELKMIEEGSHDKAPEISY